MTDHKFQQGDEVRVLDGDGKGETLYLGDDINEGNEERDEYYATAFSSLEDALNGYGDYSYYINHKKDISLTTPVSELNVPKLPTVEELQGFLAMTLLDDYDGINVHSTEPDGPGRTLIFGNSSSGKRFSAYITISSIEDGGDF